MGAPIYTDEQKARAAELREDGATYAEIERQTGIHRTSAHWICLKLGAYPPNLRPATCAGPMVVKRGGHIVRRFTPEEDRTIRRMRIDGATLRDIARKLNRKHNSIQGRLMTLARHDEMEEQDA